MRKLTPEEKIISTERRKAKQKEYDDSPERKAYFKARNDSPEKKAYDKAYQATPERKVYDKTRLKAFQHTPYSKAYHRKYVLKKHFNLTPEQHQEMFNAQNGCCAICKRPRSEFKRDFAVDHNHETGKIRGLLCTFCNIHINGFDNMKKYFAGQNISISKTIIEYLNN